MHFWHGRIKDMMVQRCKARLDAITALQKSEVDGNTAAVQSIFPWCAQGQQAAAAGADAVAAAEGAVVAST